MEARELKKGRGVKVSSGKIVLKRLFTTMVNLLAKTGKKVKDLVDEASKSRRLKNRKIQDEKDLDLDKKGVSKKEKKDTLKKDTLKKDTSKKKEFSKKKKKETSKKKGSKDVSKATEESISAIKKTLKEKEETLKEIEGSVKNENLIKVVKILGKWIKVRRLLEIEEGIRSIERTLREVELSILTIKVERSGAVVKEMINEVRSVVESMKERVKETKRIMEKAVVAKDYTLLNEAKRKVDDLVLLKRDGIGLFQLRKVEKWDLSTLESLKEEVKSIKSILNSINRKGYVNDIRIIDYPLYASFVMSFVQLKDEDKIEASYEEILRMKENSLKTHEKINLSRWIHSLINLNMYHLTSSIKLQESKIKAELKLQEEENPSVEVLTSDLIESSERWDDLMVDIDTLSR